MNLKDRVIASVEATLTSEPAGLTIEALARLVAQQGGQQVPPLRVAAVLREQPRRFFEGGDGRWRLRAAGDRFADGGASELAPEPIPQVILRRGCDVVFDLEATGQDAGAPATEIIQIAAQRWIDGRLDARWDSFVRPSVDISAQISRLAQITMASGESACIPPRTGRDYSRDPCRQ